MLVYDNQGNEYEYNEEKCKDGYIVYPIMHYEDADEMYEEYIEKGSAVILNKVFKIPPTQKKSEEIVKLEEKIKSLNNEISELKKKKKILDNLSTKTEEDIIREKLKDYPNVIKLIDILAKITKPAVLNSENYINKINGYIALNPETDKLKLIDSYGYSIDTRELEVFNSLEEAEKKMLDNIVKNPHNRYTYTYKRMIELEDVFKKHNIKRPSWWKNKFAQFKKEEIQKLEKDLLRRKSEIQYNENMIIKLTNELEKVKRD